jgi:hypothetical protein
MPPMSCCRASSTSTRLVPSGDEKIASTGCCSVVGEIAILCGTARNATVKASTVVEALRIQQGLLPEGPLVLPAQHGRNHARGGRAARTPRTRGPLPSVPLPAGNLSGERPSFGSGRFLLRASTAISCVLILFRKPFAKAFRYRTFRRCGGKTRSAKQRSTSRRGLDLPRNCGRNKGLVPSPRSRVFHISVIIRSPSARPWFAQRPAQRRRATCDGH